MFCTIDPNVANVDVPDPRFDKLCEIYKPKSKVKAHLRIIDIAGLVKGASENMGMGNAFLSHIQSVDGIFHLVRAFDDEEIAHFEGDVDPVRDMEIISEELRLKDTVVLNKAIEAVEKFMKKNDTKESVLRKATLEKVY